MFLELRPQVLKDTENRKNNILSECHTPSRMSEDDQRWASCHTLAIPRVFVAFGSVSRDNTIIIPAVNPASSYFSSHVWWATGLIFDVFSFQRLLKIEGKWQPPIQVIAEDVETCHGSTDLFQSCISQNEIMSSMCQLCSIYWEHALPAPNLSAAEAVRSQLAHCEKLPDWINMELM